jgi:hypothetical protein
MGAVAVALVGVFVTTGVSLMPVSLALGPCLRDWTSPSSYHARTSALASVDAAVGGGSVRICYGRPAMRGRTVFGQLVPYDSLWRMGANEPTRLYTDQAIRFAGIPLQPGRYSLYSVPRADSWEVFVSRSTLHWGNDISPAVRAAEVGQAKVAVEALAVAVETLTVRAEPDSDRVLLSLEWETTRVRLPLEAAH